MDFNTKIPDWKNTGAEPSEELKTEGFKAGYKPPAPYFNWMFHGLCSSVKENREVMNALDNDIVPISITEIDAVTK